MKIYILYGTWGNNETDGTDVLMVSDSAKPLEKRLEEIAGSNADGFLYEPDEDRGFWYYEASDYNGGYAKFYITEKDLDLSAETIRMLAIEAERSDRLADIKEHIQEMYENSGHAPAWKYWYASHDQGTLDRILAQFDKYESCNVPYNDTLHFAVESVLEEIQLNDDILAKLWGMFGDIQINDEDETLDDFMGFPAGTCRLEIWHWFDEHFTHGLGAFLEQKVNDGCVEGEKP